MKKCIAYIAILWYCLNPLFSQSVIELTNTPKAEGIVWHTPERQYTSPMWQNELVSNVSKPTITAYLPDPAIANGTALIIAPGGGFHTLSILSEGNWVADWCVKNGIAAFVLKYRLVPTGEYGEMEFMQKMGDQERMDREMTPIIALAKADGLAAIEYVRSHAAEFGVRPNRIGIIGFSAGGTVAGSAAFEYTAASRPDFAAPIYPALHVVNTSNMPDNPMPLFIAVTSDDFFGFQTQCTALYDQWNAAKQPIEMHIYEKGGHGFGMREQGLPSDKWIDAFAAWLDNHGWLKNYRDLNHNGKKDIYEDATQPIEKRVDDLLSQMTLEEKAGQMFINGVGVNNDGSIEPDPSKVEGIAARRPAAVDNIRNLQMSHFNVWQLPSDPKVIAKWYNRLQQFAENTRLGIPITIASDPRNHFSNNIFSMPATGFSQWPEPPGFAAIGDEELVRRFADMVRQEYLAVGIRESLFPQIDLATEPRWPRISGNFSEDAELTARLVVPYIEGLQTGDLRNGVAAMTKHFPGGGPQNEGLDPHFPFHKGQVYPGNKFDYHLIPFEAAFKAGTAAIMPYYGIPVGQTDEDVAMSFNKSIITTLLREKYQYDGVVCTDWGLISDMKTPAFTWPARAWGVEHLSEVERVKKALDAGVDQFGGESLPQHVVQLVKEGQLTEERINQSIRRLLRQKFQLGLFDDPYVDETKVGVIVGNAAFQKEADIAQRRSMTLLKNAKKTLPLQPGKLKIYVKNINTEVAAKYGTVVNDPKAADIAIIRLNTPWMPVETDIPFAKGFHHGDLDFKEEALQEVLDLCKTVPTVVDIYLDRPAVIPEINAAAKAVLGNYGASDAAVLDVIFGKAKPEGKLPFELPSSMEAVQQQKPDVPYDSEAPLYPFGFGLRYK
ncbi:MAG TPA: glycoside hydrolase family 3 N-terminal domain-containing protein [Saprospiraceae bacterium]|nr:glycoside hydrolase family 3 N-terminal domain-containing protein [Saprospiraceae bacterium]HMQ83331.1 glycoside hydrolase family 3 N-terminal domain-containing protein [Saprospiraceae bacterium]